MSDTITAVLVRDHAWVRSMIAQVMSMPRNAQSMYASIADAIRRHSSAEEATLYAALNAFPAQRPVVQSLEQGHMEIARLLTELDAMPYGAPAFMPTFVRMSQLLDAHVAYEETRVFPGARALLPRARQHALGRRYEERMGRVRARNISILLPALSKARAPNPCGCEGKKSNPCGCAKKKNPTRHWLKHFAGVGPALAGALRNAR